MKTMQRHGVKLFVLKILGLLLQEIEPNMTIHQMGRQKGRVIRRMRNFVGLPSASAQFEGLSGTHHDP